MVALSAHKNQLQERDDRIELLDIRFKETTLQQKREQALLTSAFYQVGIETQRRSMSTLNTSSVNQDGIPGRAEARGKRRVA